MKYVLGLGVLIILAGVAVAPSAEAAQVRPSVFVGAAGVCGPMPGSKIVGAAWVKHFGLADTVPNTSFALILSKNGPTTDCSAAGADVRGINGTVLTELGFDVRNGGHCGAGAPRFNVVTNDNQLHFIGGCANGTQTPDTPQQGWTRVRFDLTSLGGLPVKSVGLVFDEGTDTGPDFSGVVILDNIDINGTLIGRP
jgi:hypothetical protein